MPEGDAVEVELNAIEVWGEQGDFPWDDAVAAHALYDARREATAAHWLASAEVGS